MESYLIRPAEPKDANELATLARENFPGYPFAAIYNPELVAIGILNGEDRLVAEQNDHIIATALLGHEEAMTEIKRVLVHKEARGKGLATQLAKSLVAIASQKSLIPFADTRADQVGMQRAAKSASLTAYSVEPGKHCVYSHSEPSGPARESMIHMSHIFLPLDKISQTLAPHDITFRRDLSRQLLNNLSPRPKNTTVCQNLLPSASETAEQVCKNLGVNTADIVEVEGGIVIAPDKSAFIHTPQEATLLYLMATGIQVITTYSDAQDLQVAKRNLEYGFIPVMLRPWKVVDVTTLQIGWQLRANGYEECLHVVNTDLEVREQLISIAKAIK